ncbi:MAG: diguanylate cyclase [Bacilli bacterium]|nr:diguanylate cyclase [Bacilli bacterium]
MAKDKSILKNEKNIIKKYLNKISDISNDKKIIDNLMYIKEYGVLSMPAFRLLVDEEINKNTNGAIIMADINDLFVANKFRGKEKVNKMIKNIINKIDRQLIEEDCKNYKIGKMGDEIYIYLQDKNKEEVKIITDKLLNIKEKELSISIGSCTDLSNGLMKAMDIADGKMSINKKAFKLERLNSLCGNDLNKIIDTVVERQLDKMRIDLLQLKEANKDDLRNTFEKAVDEINLKDITTTINKQEDIKDNVDIFEELKNKYTKEGDLLYGKNEKLVRRHVFASMLSKHDIDGVISSEYFQSIDYSSTYKNIMNNKENKSFSLLALNLSGLKMVNDNFGHEMGDKAISDSLNYTKEVLESKNITMYSDIITKGGGNSYVIINKNNYSKEDDLIKEIGKYPENTNSKFNVSIISSIKDIEKDSIKKEIFLNVINNNLTILEEDIESESFNKKINDVEEMKNAIKKVYHNIINMEEIEILSNNSLEEKEKLLSKIKVGFENHIYKEGYDFNLDLSEKSIMLEKEKKHKHKEVLGDITI